MMMQMAILSGTVINCLTSSPEGLIPGREASGSDLVPDGAKGRLANADNR